MKSYHKRLGEGVRELFLDTVFKDEPNQDPFHKKTTNKTKKGLT